MKTKKKTPEEIHALYVQREELVAKMQDIEDAAQAREEGKRSLTKEEQETFDALEREATMIDYNLRVERLKLDGAREVQSREAAFCQLVREAVKARKTLEFVSDKAVERSAGTQNLASVDPLIPVKIADILEPLEEGLIYNRVGVRLETGLSGNYVWPVVGSVEATLAGEAVELTDTKIDITKLTPVLQRIGITIPVTNQAITQSEGRILDIVNTQLPLSMTRVINRAMFCPEKYNTNFAGPFGETNVNKVTFAGAVPTYAELLQMKGTVLQKGIEPAGTMAYVMDEYMKATLEATPRDAGSGLMIVEDGKIAGIPVFCTNYLNKQKGGSAVTANHVAFGCWGYQVLGQFGNFRLIIDPYSRAKEDIVQFTLNADWSMKILRPEAFVLGTVTND